MVTHIKIVNQAGEAREIDAAVGRTLMEVIRDNGFNEMLALCGGCCSCATCHIHIAPGFIDKIPEMTEDENDLLDSSEHRDAYSRLSCQVPITDAIAGMTVTIAQED